MGFLREIWYWLSWPYRYWKEEREFKKRMKEMREKDPFIYK